MAIIYVMTENKKHTYNEVLQGLLNHEAYFLNYIQSNQFEEDDLMGLKLFLEQHHDDISALKAFISETPLKRNSHTSKSYFTCYKIAASLIILIGISYFIYANLSKTSSLKTYMIEDPGFKVWMCGTSSRVDLLNGMNYYRHKNYTEALPYFSKLTDNDTALYYSGISSIQLNQLADAESFFNKIPSQSVYKNKSVYYLSLCYIFNHKEKEGLDLLNATRFTDVMFKTKKNELLHTYNQH
jgi:hypothetical protein